MNCDNCFPRPRRQVARCLAASAAALLLGVVPSAHAETWELTTGGSWATGTNWDPDGVPNATGAAAIFTGINSANRAITVDSGATGFTVGSISFDTTGAGTFTNAINTGTTGSKVLMNNGGSGATITTSGTGTGNNTFNVAMVFNDNVTATVNQTTSSSAAGSLNMTNGISGSFGFTKAGDGLVTFASPAKTYTGATSITGGRMRMSLAGITNATSSFTINGGQLNPISAGSYTLGSGTLNLSGIGPSTGPYSAFPGVIRPDTGLAQTITNNINLQGDSLIHIQGSATGQMTLPGLISGVGGLTFTALNSDANLGKLILTNTGNTYTGGTVVNGGTLDATAGSIGASTGPLTVNVVAFATATSLLKLNTSTPTTTGSLSGTMLGGASATIDIGGQTYTANQTSAGTYQGVMIGAGGFTLGSLSTNTLTLTGNNTYSGLTSINGGTLSVGSSANLGNASATNGLSFNGGTLAATGTINSAARNVAVQASGGTIDTAANAVTVGNVDGAGNFTKSGSASGNLTANRYRVNNFTVSGGVATAAAIGDPTSSASVSPGVSTVNSLVTSGTGTLNLTNSRIITNDAQGSESGGTYSGVLGQVQSDKIFTDQPMAASNQTAIGVATAAEAKGLTGSATTMWSGQTIDSNDTLVMYTWAGDANLDGKVNADDYASIDLYSTVPGADTWNHGDFNYDGVINADDYALIDNNVQNVNYVPYWTTDALRSLQSGGSATAGLTAVPEPASIGLLMASAAGLMGRRRRTK